jgi:hypothetical protein
MEREEEDPEEIILDLEPQAGWQTHFRTIEIGERRGMVEKNYQNEWVRCSSQVFVSATEFTPTSELGGCGHLGAANIQVLNVSPYNGGFKVRIKVDNSTPIPIRIHICMRVYVN